MYIKTLNFYNPQELEFLKQLKRNKVYIHFEDGTVFNGYINLKEDDPRLKPGIWGEAAGNQLSTICRAFITTTWT